MKKKGIPEGKNRYMLTLTEKTMDDLHAYLKSKHAPKSLVSSCVDEMLADLLTTVRQLEEIQAKKGIDVGMGDVLGVVAKIMNEKKDLQGRLL